MVKGNVVLRAQTVVKLVRGILAVVLLCRPVFAQTPTPQGPASSAGPVPDESVIPQWRSTLDNVREASKTYFLGYPLLPNKPLTDQELLNGPGERTQLIRQAVPQLEGAAACEVEHFADKASEYACRFEPSGPSADDVKNDYVKMVRFMEKVIGTPATTVLPPMVTPYVESRVVLFSGRVKVQGLWTCNVVVNGRETTVCKDSKQDLSCGYRKLRPS
jgi:hypothetical protein